MYEKSRHPGKLTASWTPSFPRAEKSVRKPIGGPDEVDKSPVVDQLRPKLSNSMDISQTLHPDQHSKSREKPPGSECRPDESSQKTVELLWGRWNKFFDSDVSMETLIGGLKGNFPSMSSTVLLGSFIALGMWPSRIPGRGCISPENQARIRTTIISARRFPANAPPFPTWDEQVFC